MKKTKSDSKTIAVFIFIVAYKNNCSQMVKVMDCSLEISEYQLDLYYHVHFRINNLVKDMTPLFYRQRCVE